MTESPVIRSLYEALKKRAQKKREDEERFVSRFFAGRPKRFKGKRRVGEYARGPQ